MAYTPSNPAPDPRPIYRTGAQLVRAEQWFPGKEVAGVRHQDASELISLIGAHGYVETPTGGQYAQPGQWVVEDEKGQFSICSPEDFTATYQLVEPTEA